MNVVIGEKLKLLPDAPGVYRMFNAAGDIIYIGKAVNLKNRVRQYFQSQKNMQPKVSAMVSHIADFDYILTSNETEAFTLEASLVKSAQPRYNILLKDDKHFPYVRLDERQDYPRFEVVRRVKNDGARYFGPYLSAIALRDAMGLIRDAFPVRHCKKDIGRAIARGERPCLMYHLGKCCAPCSGKVTREEYHQLLESVARFLDGDTAAVADMLSKEMQRASDNMEYERAAELRDRLSAVVSLGEKQRAIGTRDDERDVFALARDDNDAIVYALFVRNGSVVGSQQLSMDCAGEPEGEVMAAFLKQYYSDSGDIPREIALLDMPDEADELIAWLRSLRGGAVSMVRPQRGEKLKQVMMAKRNGAEAILKRRELEHRAFERGEGALIRLGALIGLESIPKRIECFDNSHIQGRDTVSVMVVFIDGAPAPKQYRRFRIRADADADDLVAMREALTRRFERAKRLDAGFLALPELLIVDGGRAQLNVALEVLAKEGIEHIPAIGLAERNEEIFVPGMDEPIVLKRSDPALHLVQRIRDEAHRFAITYHRSLRVKTQLFSELDAIAGIGDRRKRALFDAFTTRDAIAMADVEALSAVKGMTRAAAEAVYGHFHGDGAQNG